MNIHDATEQAYKNGYARAQEEIKKKSCPDCSGGPNQKFRSYVSVSYDDGGEIIRAIQTKFCPSCGGCLIDREGNHV